MGIASIEMRKHLEKKTALSCITHCPALEIASMNNAAGIHLGFDFAVADTVPGHTEGTMVIL